MNETMAVLRPPGLKPIKACHMYTKYRQFVPDEWKDITCPKPSEKTLAAFQKSEDAKKECLKAQTEGQRCRKRKKRMSDEHNSKSIKL